MGRFYKEATPEFLQNTLYTPPAELMMKILAQDNAVRQRYENEADTINQKLIQTPHLDFDEGLLNEIQDAYYKDIDKFTNSIYNDVNAYKSLRPKMKSLQNKIMFDMLNGDLGAVSKRYTNFNKFKEDNKDLADKDPLTLNVAMNYELNKLKEATAKDPRASFNPYRIASKPDIRKELTEEIKGLTANGQMTPDGRGYIIGGKYLDRNRIIDLAVSKVLSTPTYSQYARQQTMYGLPGFADKNGDLLDPYALSYKGQIISREDAVNLPEEEQRNVQRILNPKWRFTNELNSVANAYAYSQRDIKSDGTWTAIAKMKQDDDHFNREMNQKEDHFNRNLKFQYDKLAYQKEKDANNLARGSGSGKGGNGNSAYSFGNQGDFIYTDELPDNISLSGDITGAFSSTNGRNYGAEFRINDFANMLETDGKNSKAKLSKVNNTSYEELAAKLIRSGIDITKQYKSLPTEVKEAIASLVFPHGDKADKSFSVLDENGFFNGSNVNTLWGDGDSLNDATEAVYDKVKDLIENKEDKFYKEKSTRGNFGEALAVGNIRLAGNIITNIRQQPGSFQVVSAESNGKKIDVDDVDDQNKLKYQITQLADDEKMQNLSLYIQPDANNGTNGGYLYIQGATPDGDTINYKIKDISNRNLLGSQVRAYANSNKLNDGSIGDNRLLRYYSDGTYSSLSNYIGYYGSFDVGRDKTSGYSSMKENAPNVVKDISMDISGGYANVIDDIKINQRTGEIVMNINIDNKGNKKLYKTRVNSFDAANMSTVLKALYNGALEDYKNKMIKEGKK